jgi:hypothetical protein
MINASGFQLRAIRRKGAWILFKIFTRTELQAIHENCGDHPIRMFTRLAHQGNMSRMQVAHRGYNRDTLLTPHRSARCAQAGNRCMDLHQ